MRVAGKHKPKRARVGDLVEISTPTGLGYVQYIHAGGAFGELVRVLPGLYEDRPDDVASLVRLKELYFVFYILNHAIRTGEAQVIANLPVPEEWRNAYPMMRQSAAVDEHGQTTKWRVISASSQLDFRELQNTVLITHLSSEQRKLSLFEMWPHPVMVKQLALGWTPEHSEELRLKEIAGSERIAKGLEFQSLEKNMHHFLYFSTIKNAEEAGEWLRKKGFSVEDRIGSGGEKRLVLASKSMPETTEQLSEQRDELEALAVRLDGEYDGWEVPAESGEILTRN